MRKMTKASPKASPAAKNSAVYRRKMKSQGMRLLTIWVPDTKQPGFAAECERQARLANQFRDRELDSELEQLFDKEAAKLP